MSGPRSFGASRIACKRGFSLEGYRVATTAADLAAGGDIAFAVKFRSKCEPDLLGIARSQYTTLSLLDGQQKACQIDSKREKVDLVGCATSPASRSYGVLNAVDFLSHFLSHFRAIGASTVFCMATTNVCDYRCSKLQLCRQASPGLPRTSCGVFALIAKRTNADGHVKLPAMTHTKRRTCVDTWRLWRGIRRGHVATGPSLFDLFFHKLFHLVFAGRQTLWKSGSSRCERAPLYDSKRGGSRSSLVAS
jgi:hypothetical protein